MDEHPIRGKFLDGLRSEHTRESFDLPPEMADGPAFDNLCWKLAGKKWVAYAKRPFAGPEQVYSYLGQYTHRIGISNHRLLNVTDDAVIIATRDGKTATMTPIEFIRRFLQHVLPPRFVKIRHYGLMASGNVNTRLKAAQQLLADRLPAPAEPAAVKEVEPDDWQTRFKNLTGIDVTVCPACGSQRLQRVGLASTRRDSPSVSPRAPPIGGRP